MPLVRPSVEQIAGYVPGEQPQESGWVKLNTNENPYPPSPKVVEAIERTARGRLNVYPDPVGTAFREAVGQLFDVDPDWVLPANGSDENLTILLRTFVEPGEQVAFPYPSYILYETLADLQGARHTRLLLNADWSWNLDAAGDVVNKSKLLFVPNPNSPSGNRWDDETICSLIPEQGLLVLDEAYGDFADQPRVENLGHHRQSGARARLGQDLEAFAGLNMKVGIGLGVIDIKVNHIETPEEVARAIEHAESKIGLGRIQYIHPDCGFWMLKRSIADRKIAALAKGRDLLLGK